MIKAITFDLDGVYFPNGKASFLVALGKLGVLESEAKRVFLKSDEMNQQYKNGKMTDEEYWTWAACEWKLNMEPRELIALLIASYDVDAKVVSVIKTAQQNGYKTLVCSNNFPARVNGLQARFRFLDNFDAAVFSYEVGASKPSKLIFEELVRRAGVASSEIAFADDNPDNLSGAKEVGIQTFLYEGFDAFVVTLRQMGVTI